MSKGQSVPDVTGELLENKVIPVSGTEKAVTSDQGNFVLNVRSDTSVVLSVRHSSRAFLDADQTFDIPEGFLVPVTEDIKMLKRAAPLEITDSRDDTIF